MTAPESLQIGETGAITATIARSNVRRATRFSLLCERRPEAELGEVARCELKPGVDAQARFVLAPKRRGRIEIEYYGNDDLQRIVTALGLTPE